MAFSQKTILHDSMNTFDSFEAAASAVLVFLNQRIGMDLWMITRTQKADDKAVVLHAIDHGYDIRNGQVLDWSNSFCSHMVRGDGPRIVTDCREVPVYADLEKKLRLPKAVGSYIGVPLVSGDGTLFGTICAISPEKMPESIKNELPLLELLNRLLGTVLSRDMAEAEAMRESEKATAGANRDALTGLFNGRGLDELLEREEERCMQYGSNVGVLSIDLNGMNRINDEHGHDAGDDVLRRAAMAITRATRKSDITARIDGDVFVVIALESDGAETAHIVNQLREEFELVGVSAAIGAAMRLSASGIRAALQIADARMYEDKRSATEKRLSA